MRPERQQWIVEKADKNVPVANCDAKGLAFACPASSIDAAAPAPPPRSS